jgi:hypothetical protein
MTEEQRKAWGAPTQHLDDAPELEGPGRPYVLASKPGFLLFAEKGTPWTQYGSGRFVLPSRFSASYAFAVLTIEIEAGRPRCRRLTLISNDPRSPIGSSTLRSFPLRDLIADAVKQAAIETVRQPDGSITATRRVADDQETLDQFLAAYSKAAHKPRRGVRLTDENLRRVADVYRNALAQGDPAPTRAVAAAEKTSYGSARRWVGVARERGILGPTKERKAGEGGSTSG